MHVRIVLVEPRDAGNVGAAARAMKNFGFTDLWIAGAGEERTDDVSAWWAVGANDVVQTATRVATLDDALVDCHLTVATTAVRERHVHEQLTPYDVARLAEETLGEEHRLALVFGRERSGLSGREIAMCQRTASIPTWPEFPTMNLAQSVAIFCYAMRSCVGPPGPALGMRKGTTAAWPSEMRSKSKERLSNHFRTRCSRSSLTTATGCWPTSPGSCG